MSARRLYTVILSNPSKDNTKMKHSKHSRRPSRSNPSMGEMRRAAGVAFKVALGAVAGAAGVQALSGVATDMSPRNRTIAIAAGGLALGGALIATGKAPNLGAGVVGSAAAITAQRVYALHGVGDYIASMRAPAQRRPPPQGSETNPGHGLPGPSGYVVSQYMPGGFVVAEPGVHRAVNR